MSNTSPESVGKGIGWGSLPLATRGLLLTDYFVRAASLFVLCSFFAEIGWLERTVFAALWFVPEVLVFFGRRDLRRYLPGVFLFGFALILGMFPGVIAEQFAKVFGATPVVAKVLFVVVGAAVSAMLLGIGYHKQWLKTGGPPSAAPPMAIVPNISETDGNPCND
ncbi:MAG: hypothetical protein NT069_32145 [Planctomycetota bacterium]|nr:hypothetical protein [Planctomycetota bacterium]